MGRLNLGRTLPQGQKVGSLGASVRGGKRKSRDEKKRSALGTLKDAFLLCHAEDGSGLAFPGNEAK